MGFSQSYNLGCEFGWLTLIDLSCFLDLLFLIVYYLISSFNIDVAHHSDPPSFLKSRGKDFVLCMGGGKGLILQKNSRHVKL